MRHVTYDEALEALEEVVRRRGEDFTYPDVGCKYVWEEDPTLRCIVGEALITLGVVAPEDFLPGGKLHPFNDYGFGYGGTRTLEYVLREQGMATFGVRAMQLLYRAQCHQDDGTPWGSVLTLAREDTEL